MLDNVVIGRYFDIDSRLHELNPIIKFICFILIIIVSFLLNNYIAILVLLFLTILNILMSNVKLSFYLKNILSMKVLIIFILLINLIFGSSIYDIMLVILQLLIIILNTSVLLYTTKQSDLIYGLEKLFYPLKIFKINPKKIALILTLAIRFIPDILELANKMIKSQASRGIDYYNGSLKEKMLALKSMLVPLIINSFRKSNNLATVMEVRLYTVNSDMNFEKKCLKFYDIYYLVLNSLIIMMLVVKDVFL